MLNAKALEQSRCREIEIRTAEGIENVVAERIKFFDPAKKYEIVKYSKKKVALVEVITGKAILQDVIYISVVKNGMSKYFNQNKESGMLNERGQIVCEAGTLKIQRKPKKEQK